MSTGLRDLAAAPGRWSVNTATLGFRAPLAETIEAVARAGFGAIAPWRREVEGGDVRATARRIRDAGLAVSGYCRSTYLPALSLEGFLANVADNRRAIADAATLGAACFVMVVGSLPSGSRDLARARAEVEEGTALLLDHARAEGVALALEPLHPVYANDRSCLNTLAQALDMSARIEPRDGSGTGLLGVAIDVYHVWWDPDLARDIARAGRERRILAFHVSDWLVPTRDLLDDRGMPGDGVVDIPGIRAAVEAAGYEGAIEAEIFSVADWWLRPPDETLAVLAGRFRTAC